MPYNLISSRRPYPVAGDSGWYTLTQGAFASVQANKDDIAQARSGVEHYYSEDRMLVEP